MNGGHPPRGSAPMAGGIIDPLLIHIRRVAAGVPGAAGSPGTGTPTDRQLLERHLGGADPAAFSALVRRHTRLVLSACRRVLDDEADVEDAFQATFLVLFRKTATIRWQA